MSTIKKSYFLELFNKGMKVDKMAEQITTDTGINTTVSDVRKIAKKFEINLKTKPRTSKFNLVDDTTEGKEASFTTAPGKVVFEDTEA